LADSRFSSSVALPSKASSLALPTFVGIGVMRAATSWAYFCLREHPEVFVSKDKELHFFNLNYEKGCSWYASNFQEGLEFKARGEVTPNYLDTERAMARMAETIPDVRLFVMLRDPAERTYSHYHFLHERFKGMSFREACNHMPGIVNLSLYTNQLRQVYRYYPKDQVAVFLYDDVKFQPAVVLRDLFRFIGVDDTFRPPSTNKFFNRTVLPNGQRALEKVGLGWLVQLARRTPIGEWLRNRAASSGASKNKGGDEDHYRHLKEFFRSDVMGLQDLIQRDLTAWL